MITNESLLKTLQAACDRLGLGDKTELHNNDVTMLRDELMRLDEFGLANMVHEMRTPEDLHDFLINEVYV